MVAVLAVEAPTVIEPIADATESPMPLCVKQARPRKPFSGDASSIWSLVALTGEKRRDHLGVEEVQVYCKLHQSAAGCPTHKFWEARRSLGRCWHHLQSVHGFTKEEVKSLAADPSALELKLTQGQRAPATNRKRKAPAKKALSAEPHGKLLRTIPLASPVHSKLSSSFARNLGVLQNIPMQTDFGVGWGAFLRDYSQLTGAAMAWKPVRGTPRNVLRADNELTWTRVREELGQTGKLEGVIHHDCWDDVFKRCWMGGIRSYLTQDGVPRSIFFAFSSMAAWANVSETGSKTALALRDALLSAAGAKFSPQERLLTVLDNSPPLVLSDNTSSAVKVAALLGRQSARCSAHIQYIPVRRVCFPHCDDKRLKPPRPPTPNDVCPKLLNPLELLRAWALALAAPEAADLWVRCGFGGKLHSVAHADSPCHWDSTLALLQWGIKYKDDMAKFQLRRENLPAIPESEGWEYCVAGVSALGILQASLSILQTNTARAAQIPLVSAIHKKTLANECDDASEASAIHKEVHKLFLAEADRCVEVHYKAHWAFAQSSSTLVTTFQKACQAAAIQCYWDFLCLASFCAVGQSELLGDAVALRVSFERWCFHIAYPDRAEASADTDVGRLDAKATTDCVRRGQERVPGRREILKQLGPQLSKPQCTDRASSDSRQRVAAQVRSFCMREDKPGASDPLRLCKWWHTTGKVSFPDLLPGVRVLLSVPASNGLVERCFGKCSSLLSAKRKSLEPIQAFLQVNAPQLGLPGYAHAPNLFSSGKNDSDDDAEFELCTA